MSLLLTGAALADSRISREFGSRTRELEMVAKQRTPCSLQMPQENATVTIPDGLSPARGVGLFSTLRLARPADSLESRNSAP